MVKFVIPITVTGKYSMNSLYAGAHWSKRQRLASEVKAIVIASLNNQKIRREIAKNPVHICISYNDYLDCDNHGYMSKMVIDALKGYLIENDSKKYVKSVTQDFWDGSGIKVIIREVGK